MLVKFQLEAHLLLGGWFHLPLCSDASFSSFALLGGTHLPHREHCNDRPSTKWTSETPVERGLHAVLSQNPREECLGRRLFL